MTELTKEQIAQGWKLRDRIPEAPIKRGDIWQGAEFLPNGKLHIREIVSGGDPEVFAWEFFDAYRTFSPDLPSPPVSGEQDDTRISELDTQLARAEEVIRPFSEEAEMWSPEENAGHDCGSDYSINGGYSDLTVGHLRAAAQWIKEREAK